MFLEKQPVLNLSQAAANGYAEIARELLVRGASVNMQNKDGRTALSTVSTSLFMQALLQTYSLSKRIALTGCKVWPY